MRRGIKTWWCGRCLEKICEICAGFYLSPARVICGEAILAPVLEINPTTPVAMGRFGWKDQHASLLSFASDAYLNEMGITNRLAPNNGKGNTPAN